MIRRAIDTAIVGAFVAVLASCAVIGGLRLALLSRRRAQ